MSFRTWLVTCTSLTMLALAPIGAAQAQDAATDPALLAAAQALQADPSPTNRQALMAACTAAGYANIQDCLAALRAAGIEVGPGGNGPKGNGPGANAPEQPAQPAPEQPASQAAPEQPAPQQPAEQPAPEQPAPQQPAPEQPAPQQPAAEQAAPQQPAPEQPAPQKPANNAGGQAAAQLAKAVDNYNAAVAQLAGGDAGAQAKIDQAKGRIDQICSRAGFADTAACLAQFGLALTPLPAAPATPVQPAPEQPAPQQPAPQQPAPQQQQQQPAPQQQQQPAPQQQQQPAPEQAAPQQPANNQVGAGGQAAKQLALAVENYNNYAGQLAGGDASAQARIDKTKGRIDQICSRAGFADTAACLAQFGLTLTPLPNGPAAPPAPSEAPISQLPNASEAVTPSAVEVLPPDVAPSEAAPILDSAKDQQNAGPGNRPNRPKPGNGPQGQNPNAPQQGQQPAQPQPPAGPAPQNDQAAQQNLPPPSPETKSTQTDKGKPANIDFPKPVMPGPQGGATVVQPPKSDPNAVVIQIGGVNIIINIKQDRDRYYDPQQDKITYEDLSRGRVRETVTRPNGVKIVTIYSRSGEVLQRSKIMPNGREIVISTYDPQANEDTEPFYIDPGADLPPLQLNIPASDYILDADSADEEEVTQFLAKPPVEQVRRIYTPDEVKHSARLRDSVRRLEIGNLTFDTGKATIARSQVGELATVADAMQSLLDKNPGEVFLIEGHTDAVGSDVSNLVLSDQRAATVARILTDFYDIPAENLVTQGYGERYLKVKTEDAEPLNRRVTVKRITPLVSYEAANQ